MSARKRHLGTFFVQNIHGLPLNMSHNKRKLHQKRSKTCYERAFLQASNLILEIKSKHSIPPFCSCHCLLCITTNTSEQYKTTRQGILLPLLPPHTPDPACKPNVEMNTISGFVLAIQTAFDVGKLGAFGTVLPPQRGLGLQPLITAGNSFYLLRSTLVEIFLVYFSLFLAPKMLLEDH